MRNLQSVLTTDYRLDLTGWTLYEATGVSSNGQYIVGTGSYTNGPQQAWIASIMIMTSGSCTYELSATNENVAAGGGTLSVNVTASNNCTWTAVSQNPSFITINSGSSGTNNGTVSFYVAANNTANVGTGSIIVTGCNTLTVTEAGTNCTYMLTSTSANFGAAGGSCSVSVTASNGCPWTASTTNSWITITSGSSGSGSGTVAYTVAPNTTANALTGTITVFDQTFTVNQLAATPVTYTFNDIKQTLKLKLDKKTGVTITNCTITADLVVKNTGTMPTAKSSVLLWFGQSCNFNPSVGLATLTEKVKALKEGKSVTIKIKTKKLTGDEAGTFIFATDTGNNVLASVEVSSPE
jgi:hypothetical protein